MTKKQVDEMILWLIANSKTVEEAMEEVAEFFRWHPDELRFLSED